MPSRAGFQGFTNLDCLGDSVPLCQRVRESDQQLAIVQLRRVAMVELHKVAVVELHNKVAVVELHKVTMVEHHMAIVVELHMAIVVEHRMATVVQLHMATALHMAAVNIHMADFVGTDRPFARYFLSLCNYYNFLTIIDCFKIHQESEISSRI